MDDNKIVKSCWISKKIGFMQRMCMNSYLAQGHEFHLYTYSKEIKNAPSKVFIKDANEIIPSDCIFKDSHNTYATFSDWFRIELLTRYGGWWVDMDTLCVQYLNFDKAYVFATEIQQVFQLKQICNAIIKAPANSPFLLSIVKEIRGVFENKTKRDIYWTEIGAQALRQAISDYSLEKYITPHHVFCPYHYFNFTDIFYKPISPLSKETFAIHLWNQMWQRNKIDYEIKPHSKSLYAFIKENYNDK